MQHLPGQAAKAGVDLNSCFQCGKCTAGCPVAFAMDYGPRQIVRFLQLGWWREALGARSIWLCASCDLCSARCPRGVNPARLMDWLRVEAGKRDMISEPEIKIFNDIFLKLVQRDGRLSEAELAIRFNLSTGQPLKDALLAPTMLRRRKMHLLPRRIKGIKILRRVIARASRKGEAAEEGAGND
jgi:heterodisulfide reductase subunit C